MSNTKCDNCKFYYIGVDKNNEIYHICYRQPITYYDENIPFCESIYKDKMISEKDAALRMYRNGGFAGKFMPVSLMYNLLSDKLSVPYEKTYFNETYIHACNRLHRVTDYGQIKF